MTEAPQPARVPLDLDVDCRSEDLEGPLRYRAVNIGEGGLFLKTTRPLPVGTRLRCTLTLPDDSEEMTLDTEVAWTRSGPADQVPPPGMGLTFVGIAVDDLDRLQLYVDSFEAVEDGVDPDAQPVQDGSIEFGADPGESEILGEAGDEEIIDLVASPPASGMMPPPPPRPVVPGLGSEPVEVPQAPVSEMLPPPPADAPSRADGPSRAEGTSLAPGDALQVVMEQVLVEGRVVGLTEDGIEIVGGWSEARITLRLEDGDELTRLGLVELGGLGAGRVRIRLDSSELERRVRSSEDGSVAFEASPRDFVGATTPDRPASLPRPPADVTRKDGAPPVAVSARPEQPADPVSIGEAMPPEISLSGLEPAPLVPAPAAVDMVEEKQDGGQGPRAFLRRMRKSRAAVTLASCLLLAAAGAGVAGLLGGRNKHHDRSSAQKKTQGISEQSGASQGAVDPGEGRLDQEPADRKKTALSASPSASRSPVASNGSRGDVQDPAVGRQASRRHTDNVGRSRRHALRKPRLSADRRPVSRPASAGRQASPGASHRATRALAKVGLAVRRRAGTVSLLLGVTGRAKTLSSYWLAKPPGVVVDMTGVRSRLRPGNHKVADSQVRFVKVVRRRGGVRFIVYLTSKAAAAAARVHSAPGVGVVTWPGKAAGPRGPEKISMR